MLCCVSFDLKAVLLCACLHCAPLTVTVWALKRNCSVLAAKAEVCLQPSVLISQSAGGSLRDPWLVTSGRGRRAGGEESADGGERSPFKGHMLKPSANGWGHARSLPANRRRSQQPDEPIRGRLA